MANTSVQMISYTSVWNIDKNVKKYINKLIQSFSKDKVHSDLYFQQEQQEQFQEISYCSLIVVAFRVKYEYLQCELSFPFFDSLLQIMRIILFSLSMLENP